MDLMIDLETLGTKPNAAIIQIGAVWFDLDREGVEYGDFEQTIALQSCIFSGLTIDSKTVEWWMQESNDAKRSVSRDADNLFGAIDEFLFRYRAQHNSVERVWSNGSNFDIPILENAIRVAVGKEPPWAYNSVRDVRTIYWLAGRAGWAKPKRETAHTALADARAQVSDLVSAIRHLQPNKA